MSLCHSYIVSDGPYASHLWGGEAVGEEGERRVVEEGLSPIVTTVVQYRAVATFSGKVHELCNPTLPSTSFFP